MPKPSAASLARTVPKPFKFCVMFKGISYTSCIGGRQRKIASGSRVLVPPFLSNLFEIFKMSNKVSFSEKLRQRKARFGKVEKPIIKLVGGEITKIPKLKQVLSNLIKITVEMEMKQAF